MAQYQISGAIPDSESLGNPSSIILRNNEKEPFRGQAFIQLPVSPEGLFLFLQVKKDILSG